MKNLSLIFLLLILFGSCNKNKKTISDKTIPVAENLENSISLKQLFEDFEYIALETTEKSLFGKINKLICSDDKFYILDKADKQQVFVFSKKGKFLRSIGKIGKGPGEYTNIEDFIIDEKNKQVIILAYPSTIIVYDEKGQFINQKKLSSHGLFWSIVNYDEGFLCSSNHKTFVEGENAYLIFDFDKEFNLREKSFNVLPVQVAFPPFLSNSFLRREGGMAYFDFFTSTLHYDLLSKDPQSVFFDFKEKKVPPEVFGDANKFFSDQRNYSFFLDAVFIDHLFLSYFFHNGKQNIAMVNFDTNNWKSFESKRWLPPLLSYENGTFYSRMNSLKIVEGHNFFEANKINDYPIEANSNPVILKFKSGKLLKKGDDSMI